MRFTAFLATLVALLGFGFAAPMSQVSSLLGLLLVMLTACLQRTLDDLSTLEARGIGSLALKFIKKINPAKPPSPIKPASPAMKAEHQRMELLRNQPWYKEPTN